METDQEFVEFIIKALVDNPADVRTDRTVDEMGVLITLHINPADMGQVIGRMGQTAKAVRTLLRVVGAKHKARVNLKIDEPEGSHRGPRREREDHGSHESHEGNVEATESNNDSSAPDMDDFKL
ncbi:MAG TPA: KH domain-containing protein [Patescibacteria group bacterium]|jgi:hypothetical protein|nr:KH domain-containing protein [Patescibacteria group bacterium]